MDFIAQLREFRGRQSFGARRFVDQLRRTIEILRIERRQNLRRSEFGPQARDLLVERDETTIVGIDASCGFQKLQCDVEFAVVER